jgi:peptidoglycan-associated lipoprotein
MKVGSKFFMSLVTVALCSFMMVGCASKKGAGTTAGGAGGDYGYNDKEHGGAAGLGLLDRIYFEYDKSEITGKAADTLKKNASTIKGSKKMRVLVEGHCDERGTNEYNIALGERRARTTLNYLVSLGVPRSRLEMKSWGEERPLDAGHVEASWAKNRRAEFSILAK